MLANVRVNKTGILMALLINHLRIKFHVKTSTSLRVVTYKETHKLGEDNRRTLLHPLETCYKWQRNLKGRYPLENVILDQRIVWFCTVMVPTWFTWYRLRSINSVKNIPVPQRYDIYWPADQISTFRTAFATSATS